MNLNLIFKGYPDRTNALIEGVYIQMEMVVVIVIAKCLHGKEEVWSVCMEGVRQTEAKRKRKNRRNVKI